MDWDTTTKETRTTTDLSEIEVKESRPNTGGFFFGFVQFRSLFISPKFTDMPVRSSQEDFLLRELRRVAEMIARALGFSGSGDLPSARAEIDNAYKALLEGQSDLLRMLDVPSAARLIGNPKKIAAFARITAADAALAAASGNSKAERHLAARASSLTEEAVKLDPTSEETS
jgi:hypothetical protein